MRASFMLIALLLLLTSCGQSKTDVAVFMMPEKGTTAEAATQLKADLLEWAEQQQWKIEFDASPMYFQEKLIAEIVGGRYDVMIIPNEKFYSLATFDGFVDLSDVFDRDTYPQGVLELERKTSQGQIEKQIGLYGIPLDESAWYIRSGLEEKGLMAFILKKSKRQELAKKVIEWIAQK